MWTENCTIGRRLPLEDLAKGLFTRRRNQRWDCSVWWTKGGLLGCCQRMRRLKKPHDLTTQFWGLDHVWPCKFLKLKINQFTCYVAQVVLILTALLCIILASIYKSPVLDLLYCCHNYRLMYEQMLIYYHCITSSVNYVVLPESVLRNKNCILLSSTVGF